MTEPTRTSKVQNDNGDHSPGPPRAWGWFEGQVTVEPGAFEPLSDDEVADWDDAPLDPDTGTS